MYKYLDKYFLLPLAEFFYGSRIGKNYRFLKESEWWTRNEIENYQFQKIKKLLIHCNNNVPYYTDLFNSIGFKSEHLKSLEDLKIIPLLTKGDIRENYDKLISKDINIRNYKTHTTGGSTGFPLKYLSDINTWSIQWASTYRAFDWWDHALGDRIFTIGGHSLVSEKKLLNKKDIWDKAVMRNFKYSSAGMTEIDMMYYYKKLSSIKPNALRGYASSLYILARFIEKNNLKIPVVKRIMTTGEQLMPNYRAKLQEIFKAPLFDQYGAGDGGIQANECYMHEGYHITEESCYIEILPDIKNSYTSLTEKLGNVITTDLENFTFPFIRYDVGDLAVMNQKLCSCGRKSRILNRIEGRSGMLLYTKYGTPISPTMLPVLLYRNLDYNNMDNQNLYNKIDRFKIIQDAFGDIVIYLKFREEIDDYILTNYGYILDNYRNHFPGSDVRLEIVKNIGTMSSGKEDYVESNFKKYKDNE